MPSEPAGLSQSKPARLALKGIASLGLAGLPPIYTDVEKEWIIDAACQKPIDLSLAAAVWSTTLLTRYVKKSAESARLPRLEGISRSTVFRILDNLDIKPFRIREYCEKRDPDFEKKSTT